MSPFERITMLEAENRELRESVEHWKKEAYRISANGIKQFEKSQARLRAVKRMRRVAAHYWRLYDEAFHALLQFRIL